MQLKTLYLSQIFNWYEKDFTSEQSSLIDFVLPYLSKDDQQFLKKNKIKIKFLEYDWNLNTQKISE